MSRDSIEEQLARILNNYTDDVIEMMDDVAEEVSNETIEELKKSSPVGSRGKYAKKWYVKSAKERKGSKKTIGNKEYRLTHLLEKGHALKNGGRSRAFPHIEPAEKKAIQKYETEVERRLRR